MAMLADADVDLLFAGSINTFSQVAVAGVRMLVTGGGGADMEAFDETGHHWLLVTIPDAWGTPERGDIQFEVRSLE